MSKLYDTASVINVLGNIYLNPTILDDEKYHFNGVDFENKFHKLLFGTMYNLYLLGTETFNIQLIEDYLQDKPESYALYKVNKGTDYLKELEENVQPSTFDYYYNRMKKFTLLREYTKMGLDISWLYDEDNILNVKKKEKQEQWLDGATLNDIAEKIDNKIDDIKIKYINNTDTDSLDAGHGIFDLLDELKVKPAYGYPMYGKFMNTITRGARLGKVYMRSAQTGLGKSRAMIADACNFACNEIYNRETMQWEEKGSREPTLYITTEQTLDEIQTMLLSFISSVDEEHILTNNYLDGEEERVRHAAGILSKSPLYIKELPDFSLQDVENCIKRELRVHNVRYICYDYIHSSIKLLSEIGSKSGAKGLREDNFLFLLGVKIKEIAVEYQVFIITATQLNGDARDAEVLDQNVLRGAKALADKLDVGIIMVYMKQADRDKILPIAKKLGVEEPTIKMSIYKNRGNRYNNILVWCADHRDICRIDPLFVTTMSGELIENIPDINIKISSENMTSAF